MTMIGLPAAANPSCAAVRVAFATVSVIECTSGASTACTPQTRANRRAVLNAVVSPRIGASGRSRAARNAVLPLAVKAQITAASIVWATWRAAPRST